MYLFIWKCSRCGKTILSYIHLSYIHLYTLYLKRCKFLSTTAVTWMREWTEVHPLPPQTTFHFLQGWRFFYKLSYIQKFTMFKGLYFFCRGDPLQFKKEGGVVPPLPSKYNSKRFGCVKRMFLLNSTVQCIWRGLTWGEESLRSGNGIVKGEITPITSILAYFIGGGIIFWILPKGFLFIFY